MPSDSPRASLIICTFNREELFVKTVKYALDQNYDNLEIIIVDQTKEHQPDTKQFLESVNDKINYIFLETPSITKARNVGLKNSTGEILIYIDDDTEFDESFIKNHVAMHMRGFEVVQGRVIERKHSPQSHKPHWLAWNFKFSGNDDCDREGPTNVITGCNFSVSKKAAEAVNGFDERFTRLAIREDTDFGYRCYKAGFKMIFSPEAKLKHHRSESGGVGSGIGMHFFSDSYYYNEWLFCKKHFNPFIQFYYKIRLKLRGKKALRKLINRSFDQAEKSL